MKDKISNKYENLDILNLKPTSPKENKCLDKSKKEKIRIPRKKKKYQNLIMNKKHYHQEDKIKTIKANKLTKMTEI